jgi:hypothetical protein
MGSPALQKTIAVIIGSLFLIPPSSPSPIPGKKPFEFLNVQVCADTHTFFKTQMESLHVYSSAACFFLYHRHVFHHFI